MSQLDYYTAHGVMTDPGGYVGLYKDLPSDVAGLVKVVQGVLIHDAHSWRYGFRPAEQRKQRADHKLRRVEDMLERLAGEDGRPIVLPRQPPKRLLVNCRHFAVLLCSLLRHRHVPARVRVGHGTYFSPGGYENHWICEYWSAPQKRWVQADPQFDGVLRGAFGLGFDTLDLPRGKFLRAGAAWRSCRAGELDPKRFGVGGLPIACHWTFVKGDAIRDFMALNKTELLPWEGNEFISKRVKQMTPKELAVADRVAELAENVDENFAELRSFHDAKPLFRMPKGWDP